MDQFSPGCALGWLALLIVLGAVAVAVSRSLARDRQRARRRGEEIAARLRERGFDATSGEPFPKELPRTPLVRRARPRRCVRVGSGDSPAVYVFDHEVSQRPPLGRNVETLGTGDDLSHVSRHTVVCLHDARLALPAFEILPNVEGALRGAALGMAASWSDRPGAEAAARFVGGLLDATSFLHDPRRPLPLADRPELTEAYRVLGKDAPAIEAMLTDPVAEHLLAHPASIVCGTGEWLLCSRRRAGARGDLPVGLLTTEETSELVDDATALAVRLGAL